MHLKRFAILYEVVLMFVMASYSVLVFSNPRQRAYMPRSTINWVDIGLTLLFALEYMLRLHRADYKWKFVLRNWFDLIAIIPINPHIILVRFLRLLRVVRLLKASPFVRACIRVKPLRWLFLALVAVIFWSASALYFLEHGINTSIKTFGDALWWAVVTASTVGYGDVYPVTGAGRVVAVVLILASLGLVGAFATELAANWRVFVQEVRSEEDAKREQIRVWLDELDSIDDDLMTRIASLLNQETGEKISNIRHSFNASQQYNSK